MDYKKMRVETTAVTRNVVDFIKKTNNIYETVSILSKRSNQIALEIREELHGKLEEFSTSANDNLEEIFENREQIEITKHYEVMPKPTLIAVSEFLHGKIFYRNPIKESSKNQF